MNHNAIFSPDGQEIWTSQMSSPGSVLVLDPSTLETKATIPVGDAPAEVTFTPEGGHALVANTGSDSVSVIEVGTKMVVETIQVGDTPVGAWPVGAHAIAFSDDGQTAYVTNQLASSVSVIDVAGRSVVTTIMVGLKPNGIVFRPAL